MVRLAASSPRPTFATRTVLVLAAVTLFLHLVTNVATPYGFHRDEFLYMAMGRHLQLWRMDFPPAIAALAEASRAVLGDSLVAVRFVPALAGTAVVLLAALLARELGGGRFAQALAALAVLANPLFLRSANLFQPVVLDQLCWTLGFYALVRLCQPHGRSTDLSGRPGWWLALGVAGGVGLLAKFSILFFGFAVLLGLVISPQRRALKTRWPWLALLVALLIGSPSIVGQLQLGLPVLGQMRDLQSTQLQRVSASDFLGGQVLLGPGVALAAIGLLYLLRADAMRAYRLIGWTCATVFVTLLLLQGKPYYAGPVYPVLFAAGAAALEAWTDRMIARHGAAYQRPRRAPVRFARMLRAAAVLLVLAYGVATLPFGLPILPPPEMARYAEAMGITAAVTTNTGEVKRLPQDYADMLGWEEQVATVARVYHALLPEERARAVIVAANYGEAGALDFFGPRHGLPPTVSAAGSYWFFGPGDRRGDVVVAVGVPGEVLERYFRSCTLAARVTHPWAVTEESDVPMFVCRDPYQSLQALWPSLAGHN